MRPAAGLSGAILFAAASSSCARRMRFKQGMATSADDAKFHRVQLHISPAVDYAGRCLRLQSWCEVLSCGALFRCDRNSNRVSSVDTEVRSGGIRANQVVHTLRIASAAIGVAGNATSSRKMPGRIERKPLSNFCGKYPYMQTAGLGCACRSLAT